MNLANILQETSIVINSTASSREEVLHEIAALAAGQSQMRGITEEQLYQAFMERENLGSTGLANRIAIPHCRIEGIKDFSIGVVIVPRGVDYQAIDKKPTRVFVYIIAPEEQRNEHLRILSAISRYLRVPENVNKLLLAKTPKDVHASFLRHTKIANDLPQKSDHLLFNVVIQREDSFEDVLDLFTEIEGANIAVIEGAQASTYLYKMPLFASFWKAEPSGFCRIIQCVMPQAVAQECMLQLKGIIDENKKSGIFFSTQTLSHVYGNLDV
ncbi:MAG: PTS sugar transporter subunit IIA [Candidatus Cloacimonetes bacterium]|nr:PTS sugar transporter subunit IIA [Candidatus Cloacimonadota bacterium]